MMTFFRSLWEREEGASMVEYALMVALIAATLVTALSSLRTSINGKFTTVSTAISGS